MMLNLVLARYPGRQAVTGMIRAPGGRAVSRLRGEALVESVLPPTTAIGV